MVEQRHALAGDIELASLVVPKIASPSAPWSSSQRQNATKAPGIGLARRRKRGQNRDQHSVKRLRGHLLRLLSANLARLRQ